MDLQRFTKTELLKKCTELGLINCKTKNKTELIKLITSSAKPPTEIIPVVLSNDTIDKFINKIIHKIIRAIISNIFLFK